MHNAKCQTGFTVIFNLNQIGAGHGSNRPGYQYVSGG